MLVIFINLWFNDKVRECVNMLKKIAILLFSFVAISSVNAYCDQDITVKLNDSVVEFTSKKPVVVNNRTLIPLRGLFENMGYNIEWEPNTKAAILTNNENTILIRNEANYIVVNDVQKSTDVPAQIIDGSMMIPLRAVTDATGAGIAWDANTKTVSITTDGSSEYTVAIDDYAKAYNETIKPLEDLEGLVNKLNSLDVDSATDEINDVLAQLKNAKTTIAGVKTNLQKLVPDSRFQNFHDIALRALDEQSNVCDILIKGFEDRKISYTDLTKLITEALERARALNNELSNISFIF